MRSWARRSFQIAGAVCLAGGMAMAQPATALPGTVNYTEGSVNIDGQPVSSAKSSQPVQVAPGQVLRTNQGKAEMLLTPGVFLRLSDNSAVRMVSPSLTDTRVDMVQGEAMIEADQVLEGNHLVVSTNGVDTQIMKHGLYRFTTNPAQVAVYDGKAQVFVDERSVEVGSGKELALAQGAKKAQSFDKHMTDNLYLWSSVRSQYVAEANQSSVQYIVAGYPYGFYGLGWYWNPWFASWAFIPSYGYFGSPFGFGFYSPAYWRVYPPASYFVRPGVSAAVPVRGFAPAFRGSAPMVRMGGGFGGRR
jgi:FecR protein